MAPSTFCSLFPASRFVHTYMHNLKTKGRIRMFYLSNNCSTIGDVYSLSQSCMQDRNGKLWIRTCITNIFQHYILYVLTLITRKVQFVCRSSTYRMNALLSVMSNFVLELDARCDWQVMSPNVHHSVFLISHLCVLTSISQKLQVICGHFAY